MFVFFYRRDELLLPKILLLDLRDTWKTLGYRFVSYTYYIIKYFLIYRDKGIAVL